MVQTEAFAQVTVCSQDELQAWLEANHAQSESVWLVTYKRAPGAPYVSREAVLDELIRFGWVDGVRRKLDATRTLQLISPRRQQAWAKTYQERAARLIAEGSMHPAGLQAIAASKASGRWDELAHVDALQVPTDLAKALEAAPAAAAFFHAAAPSYRRNVLRWLASAKREETRQKRVSQIVKASANGEKIPHL